MSNRDYDFISLEDFKSAKKSLETKTIWSDLTQNEIAVLRQEASNVGLLKDTVDHIDRLALVRCLLYWAKQVHENSVKEIKNLVRARQWTLSRPYPEETPHLDGPELEVLEKVKVREVL